MNDLYPNMVFDEEATQQKREEVAQMVVPVEYKKGHNIVRKGEAVSYTHLMCGPMCRSPKS